jgi:hypothetical protein
MKKMKPILIIAAITAAILLIVLGCTWLYMYNADYYFYKTVPPAEAIAREKLVQTAEGWLGYQESDGSHRAIIDLYNSHQPLAQNYTVKYDDEWCATFVSAAAIQCGYTDIIPTECGCQRQIGLFGALGTWEEADDYKPLPGDIIYYCWSDNAIGGDCTGWSDHVGIVVGTAGNFIKVIEGNKDNQVGYRYISVDSSGIRGYAVPDYSKLCDNV